MTVAIGALDGYDENGAFSRSGSTRIFIYDESVSDWVQLGQVIKGDRGCYSFFWFVSVTVK